MVLCNSRCHNFQLSSWSTIVGQNMVSPQETGRATSELAAVSTQLAAIGTACDTAGKLPFNLKNL